jgi:hypothetical protein
MFEELYYWMTTRLAKIKSNDNPPFNAYFLIMILQIFNIVTLFVIVNYYTKVHLPKNSSIYIGLSLALILAVINYPTLYKRRKEIFEKFENMELKRKKKGLIYFWLYVCLSTIIFLVAGANLVTPYYLQK